jgi:hypothetical protein
MATPFILRGLKNMPNLQIAIRFATGTAGADALVRLSIRFADAWMDILAINLFSVQNG